MRRRQFISLLSGAAAWPLVARAQRRAMPVIGYLSSVAPDQFQPFLAALRGGLAQTGFEESRNVAMDFRFAGGRYEQLPALAADLVRQRVEVIVAAGGNVSALAAKAATATIPIVFTAIADPVQLGLAASLNRPGGNITGITILTTELDPKRLQLLSEAAPGARLVGALINPSTPPFERRAKDMRATAAALGRELVILTAATEKEIDAAFDSLRARPIGALAVLADPFFTSRLEQIVALAAHHRVPAIYQWRDFALAGGLMSYGPSLADSYRQAGVYTGRILKGEKPADLPILQPTKLELVLNLNAAKALGLPVTEAMLSRADEVIE